MSRLRNAIELFLTIAGITLLLCLNSYGNEPDYGKVIFGIDDFKPYGWYDENGEIQGLSVEIARDIIKDIDGQVSFDFYLAPPERYQRLLLTKQVDIIFTGEEPIIADNAIALGAISNPVLQLWSRKDNPVELDKTIGKTIASHQAYRRVNQALDFPVAYVQKEELLIPMLLNNRVDGVIGLERPLMSTATSMGHSKDEFFVYDLYYYPIYAWTYKNSAIAKNPEPWKKSIGKFVSERYIDEILRKYIQKNKQ